MTDRPATASAVNHTPLGGAMADEDDAWEVMEILTRARTAGPDAPGMAARMTDLAVLVAAEVDQHERTAPLPPPLHRLRRETVALLRRAAPDPAVEDRVMRQTSLALLLFHSGGATGDDTGNGAPMARIAECLEALRLLEDAYDSVPPESTAPPEPVEILHLLFQLHGRLDDLLDLAQEFRAQRPEEQEAPRSTALRKLAGKIRLRRQYVLTELRRLTASDDPDLGLFTAADVLTELQRMMEDTGAMVSGRVPEVLDRARRVREQPGLDADTARLVRLLESRVELKWNLEHRLDSPEGRSALLATVDYLDGVRVRGDETALRESVLFAEAAIHAVNAGLLAVSRTPDIVEACDTAVAGLPPHDAEYPGALLVRGLARALLVHYSLSTDAIAGAIEDVSRALPLVPPDHPGVPNALLVLSQSLLQRSHTTGSVADIRKALALLDRYASDTLPDGTATVVMRLLQALTHIVFHRRAGSEDVDCGTPISPGANHVDVALRTVRRTMERAQLEPLGETLTGVACRIAAQTLALAAELPGRDSAALAAEALPWADRACAVARPNSTDRHHALLLRELLHIVAGDDADAARERLLSYAETLTEAADSTGPEAGLAQMLRSLIGLAGAVAADSTVAELRAAAEAARHSPLRELRVEGAMRLAGGLRKRALSQSWTARMDAFDAALPAGNPPPGLAPLLDQTRSRFDQVRAARIAQPDAGGPDPDADFEESRRIALDCLREHARTVMGQDDTADALIIARDAGALARRAARWAAYDGAWDDVVRALETGRAIVEQTRLRPDTAARLRALGEHTLADAWEHRAPSAPGALAYRPGDPGRGLSIPDQLTARVARVLDADAEGRARDVPTVASVAAALRTVGAHALVYLLPSPPQDGQDALERGAVLVTPDGTAEWVALPSAPGDDEALAAYVDALCARTRPTEDPDERAAGVARWRTALGDLSERTGRSQLTPLLQALNRRCGRRTDGRHRVVLVPVGDLAFVPWAAAVLERGVPAVDRLVMTTVCGARQLIAASALPPVGSARDALLVNGLGGKEAAWAATRLLREGVYPDAVVPARGEATGPWLLGQLADARGRFGVVDIAAHLAADVTESWRAYIALPGGGLRIDRIGALDLAGGGGGGGETGSGSGPGTGPGAEGARGVCVSLACCASNISLSHPDEGFTVASAFLAARASAVIASLWPLTNATTGFLMTVFHYHLSVGREPAEALRRAQRWMRDPDRRAPGGFPEPLARAFEDRVARVEASLRERGDSMTAPAHWAGVVHLGR
ncbi:CHAT domain-containing protein [Streptomyces sp. DSM 110735]|uniref:CHAT domain-containing protein n=1 Tax=Streptomyces sp. DSM 110735 TaxID=2775031 RepID=UPI0018F623B0|nr:CHAT domain-containing protein [Streptomyces sp. DSM 110735]MBJ7903890.1 CHAT domain-containing protein [Streptomyces sp. DSM 110735]